MSTVTRTVRDRSLSEILQAAGDDPAPPQAALPRERAVSQVRGITLQANDELRALRDEIDNLMRGLSTREEQIVNILLEHSAFAEQAVAAKVIIAEHLVALRTQFDQGEPSTKVGTTVTVRS